MKLLPVWIIALLLTSPILATTSETYSFVKNDLAAQGTLSDGAFRKLTSLKTVYTEKAVKIHLIFSTLTATSNYQFVMIGFGSESDSPQDITDLALYVEISVQESEPAVYKVVLYHYNSPIASVMTPSEVPTELTLEIQDGKLDCDELEIRDFGVGSLTIDAIYGKATFYNGTADELGTAKWEGGYVTVEISKNVGMTWIINSITPALTLYVELMVIISVVGAIIGAIAKLGKWI